MYRLLIIILLGFSFSIQAQQSSGGGGGNNDELKNTCEVSGGQWTGSSSGNWACCWDDWGCYGCLNGICKIKCHNERCRKANGLSRIPSNMTSVPQLAPLNAKPPVIPKYNKNKIGKLIIHGRLPEGVKIKNNKIKLNAGYEFKKVSKNRVQVFRRMHNGGTSITGSFDCTCNGHDGGCSIVTTPNSVTCANSTCKSTCYMITTIPNPTPMVIQ